MTNGDLTRPIPKTGINSYLPGNSEKDSPLHRALVDQLQYAFPKTLVQHELDARGLKRETEIWIYPDYPSCFTAIVGLGEKVYIFWIENGVSHLTKITRCLGVRPNGSLIY